MASEESEAAKKILADLEAQLSDLNHLLEPSNAELELDRLQHEKEDQIRQLRIDIDNILQQKKKYQQDKFDYRRQVRQITFSIEAAERDVELAAANELMLAELAAKAHEFDKITADAIWRVGAEPLFEHQMFGAHFLAAAGRAICADEMGLGKTRQAIAALDMMQVNRVLIVCPGDLMTNWERELNMFAPEYATFILGKMSYAQQLSLIEMVNEADPDREEKIIYLVNYESWARSDKIIKDLQVQLLDTVIFDEAHQVKNSSSKKFKGIKDLVYYENTCPVAECNEMLLPGEYMCLNKHIASEHRVGYYDDGYKDFIKQRRSIKNVLILTGTPIMNQPDDMWTLLNLVNEDLFPNINAFKRMFCDVDYYTGKLTWRRGGQKELADKIKGFYIRREKKDAGIVLPPQTVIIHDIEWHPEDYPLQAKILEMLKTRAQIAIDEGRVSTKMQMLALITRQRQATVWPGGIKLREPMWDYEGNPIMDYSIDPPGQKTEILPVGDSYRESIKMDKACELVDELNAAGNRVVIVSQFKEVLIEFCRRQNGENNEHVICARFDGDTSDEDREAIRQDFDPAYDHEVKFQNVAVNYKTGGVGLNLTKASAMVILDEYWNSSGNNQMFGRIDRLGQTKETSVHILRLDSSIDHWMAQLIEQKRNIIENFDAANDENAISMDDYKKFFER